MMAPQPCSEDDATNYVSASPQHSKTSHTPYSNAIHDRAHMPIRSKIANFNRASRKKIATAPAHVCIETK